MARLARRDLLWRALYDDLAAALAALGPEVHDPVRGRHDVRVVLDDDDWDAWLNARSETDRRALMQPMDADLMTAEAAPRPSRKSE